MVEVFVTNLSRKMPFGIFLQSKEERVQPKVPQSPIFLDSSPGSELIFCPSPLVLELTCSVRQSIVTFFGVALTCHILFTFGVQAKAIFKTQKQPMTHYPGPKQ